MLNDRPGCQPRIYFREPTLEPSQAQIRWYGNVARMQDLCLAKVVFFGELNSKHSRGQRATSSQIQNALKYALEMCIMDSDLGKLLPWTEVSGEA